MWSMPYPVGIATIKRKFRDENGGPLDLGKWIMGAGEGFAMVDVTVNKSNLYPILPTRGTKVNHTCNDIVGNVYTLVELRAAVKRGDIVTKIYEAHLYSSTTTLWQ